jgi:enoyl-CoA hydratase
METAREAASKIAAQSQPIAMMTKEAINAGYEMSLAQGVQYERRLFQSMFTTQDQKEGMAAFIEKRKPHFKNK